MSTYLYCWQLEPRKELRVSVEVAAGSAVDARRVVDAFLRDHGATRWALASVSRGPRIAEREHVAVRAAPREVPLDPMPADLCSPVLRARLPSSMLAV